ncbi:transposase [Caldisericum sp.]|uniref:transposase n=1 Tax=Caldisericum sp. TaxID=2499687 RepID=UPI003D0C281C
MRGYFESYKDIQKIRIAIGNQLRAENSDQARKFVKEKIYDQLYRIEKSYVAFIRSNLKYEPIYTQWLKDVKGIGPVLSAVLISYIDVSKFPTISKLWRYAGLGVTNGLAERRKKGEKAHFNPKLKTLCYLIGMSFIRNGEGYRKLYDKFKEEYKEKWKDGCPSPVCQKNGICSENHKHMAALRKTVKVFLAHYWMEGRRLKGLSCETPYIIGKEGHSHLIEVIRDKSQA